MIPKMEKIIIEKGNHYIESAIRTTRELAQGISPLIVKQSGYVMSLLNFIQTIKDTHILKIDFSYNSNDSFGSLLESTLYRITTELISNTLKYGSASRIKINFSFKKEDLLVTFSYNDDGMGLDLPNIEETSNGLGLLKIQQQVKRFKGLMQNATSSGDGMKVYIEFPVSEYSNEF